MTKNNDIIKGLSFSPFFIMYQDKTPYRSLIFVGDPHSSSRNISRRNDEVSLQHTIMDKIAQVAELSHKEQAMTVFLGDLFDSDKEHSVALLSDWLRVLKTFYAVPYSIVGNHDKSETLLRPYNMLYALFESGLLREIPDIPKTSLSADIDGVPIEIGATHYGSKIPSKVQARQKDCRHIIWLSHHDLMFDGVSYAGCQTLHEIRGVDLAVNGHIHIKAPNVRKGQTVWCNKGNILRQSIDTSEHIPAVQIWTPQDWQENQDLTDIPLRFKKDIFRKNREIQADVKPVDVRGIQHSDKSRFLALLQEHEDDSNATADQDPMKQHLKSFIQAQKMPAPIAEEFGGLFEMD